MESTNQRHLLKAEEIRALPEVVRVHPLNPDAVRNSRSLGDAVGLRNLGFHLVRVEPGKATTEFHFHHQEEEFLYILSGRGLARIGDASIEVGPGDFLGFTAPSAPHDLTNCFDEDLVYLVGGERRSFEATDYPDCGKRLYRMHGERHYVDWQHPGQS